MYTYIPWPYPQSDTTPAPFFAPALLAPQRSERWQVVADLQQAACLKKEVHCKHVCRCSMLQEDTAEGTHQAWSILFLCGCLAFLAGLHPVYVKLLHMHSPVVMLVLVDALSCTQVHAGCMAIDT